MWSIWKNILNRVGRIWTFSFENIAVHKLYKYNIVVKIRKVNWLTVIKKVLEKFENDASNRALFVWNGVILNQRQCPWSNEHKNNPP